MTACLCSSERQLFVPRLNRLANELSNDARGDEVGDGVDVGGERAVGEDFGRFGADRVIGFGGEDSSFERGEQVDALACAEQFDS